MTRMIYALRIFGGIERRFFDWKIRIGRLIVELFRLARLVIDVMHCKIGIAGNRVIVDSQNLLSWLFNEIVTKY